MAGNADIKEHVSLAERTRWDQVVVDFAAHLGAGGIGNHPLGDGVTPGFSMNDYTNAEKGKLGGIEVGANRYIHPESHPYTMIDGLSVVGHSGNYYDLLNIPKTFIAGGGDCDTIKGIRITIGGEAPAEPKNDKDLWFDTNARLTKVYHGNVWVAFCAVWG